MNNTDRERIKRRIRSMEEAPYCPTDERIEEIKLRAFEEYERYLRANEERKTRKNKKRSILRRAVAIIALAVCFLGVSFVYSVFAPVTIANTNNFVRRASIWINNQLHLGIIFSNPIDDVESVTYSDDKPVQSIIELRSTATFPIIYIPESEVLTIQNIDLNIPSPNQEEISIWYSTADNKTIVIRNIQMFERNAIGIDTESLNAIETPIGTVYTWTDGAYSYAFCYTEGGIAYMTSSIPIDDFEQYVNLFSFLN